MGYTGAITTRWGEKALAVVAGIAIVVLGGVGAVMILRAQDVESVTATTTTAAQGEPGIDVPKVLRSGGLDRTYVVHVPASYDGSRAVPLRLSSDAQARPAKLAARVLERAVIARCAGHHDHPSAIGRVALDVAVLAALAPPPGVPRCLNQLVEVRVLDGRP